MGYMQARNFLRNAAVGMKSGFFAMLGEAWRAMGANRLRTLLTMLGKIGKAHL